VEQYVTSKPRDNALGIAAAVLACALLFGCAQSEALHSRHQHLHSHFHDLTSTFSADGMKFTTGSAPRASTCGCLHTFASWSRRAQSMCSILRLQPHVST
jgi:hypothetical protein